MSTENGSTAHKGSYINGIKHVFSMGWRSERDQNKDGLGNTDCLGKVYLLKSPDSDFKSQPPEVNLSVTCLINMSFEHKSVSDCNHEVFLALNECLEASPHPHKTHSS